MRHLPLLSLKVTESQFAFAQQILQGWKQTLYKLKIQLFSVEKE